MKVSGATFWLSRRKLRYSNSPPWRLHRTVTSKVFQLSLQLLSPQAWLRSTAFRTHNTTGWCTISAPKVSPSLHLDPRFLTPERDRTVVVTFRNFHVRVLTLTLNSSCSHSVGSIVNNEQRRQHCTGQQVEMREWWLWGFAITVTLVLTAGIVSLTFPDNHLLHNFEWLNLRVVVRGLACLVLLFDIYTVLRSSGRQIVCGRSLITKGTTIHDAVLLCGPPIKTRDLLWLRSVSSDTPWNGKEELTC
jgi:hypothetical protein